LSAKATIAIDTIAVTAVPLPQFSIFEERPMPRYSEEEIREYAHKLWEREGRPEGKADDFWHQAKSELESDAPGDEDPKPMPE
jgi:hypothetical protein